MEKKYIVRLTEDEQAELTNMVSKGKTPAYRIKHANILLAVDGNGMKMTDEEAAEAYRCHENTVRNVRQRLVEHGMQAALKRKAQDEPSRPRILDGQKEARLIAIACGQPPDGRSCWTLKLLADKLVELGIVEAISAQTVRRTLKKTNCVRTLRNVG
jgi:transposase